MFFFLILISTSPPVSLWWEVYEREMWRTDSSEEPCFWWLFDILTLWNLFVVLQDHHSDRLHPLIPWDGDLHLHFGPRQHLPGLFHCWCPRVRWGFDTGEMCSLLLVPNRTWAAAFWTKWRVCMGLLGQLMKRQLQLATVRESENSLTFTNLLKR